MTFTLFLQCKSIKRTRSFYRSVLKLDGFFTPDDTLTVINGDARIVFTEKNLWGNEFCLSGAIYVSSQQIYEDYERIKQLCPISWPLQKTVNGGYEFGINDCNGYTLVLHQITVIDSRQLILAACD